MKRMPNWLNVILILLVFGLVRAPFENSLRKQMRAANMLLPTPGHDAMSQMGQSALMGLLGGLRTLVATGYLLDSFRHFENQDWDANRKSLILTTYLEPTDESHWVLLVWNRGINAPAWLEVHSDLPEFEKKLRYNEYTLDAVKLGYDGLKQIPDAVDLRIQIGEVYREKLKDMCGAAKIYGELKDLKGAPQYAARFHGYFLSECPGKEREAYDYLLNLYWESEKNHLPTLVVKIRELQEQLNIPYPLWIPDRKPPPRKRKPLQGGILLP